MDLDSLTREQLVDRVVKLQRALEIYEKERIRFRHSKPEFTGEFFISGYHGFRDNNLLPEFLQICPAYGADWSQIYQRIDRTIGPEY
jgi:hypothetical protein